MTIYFKIIPTTIQEYLEISNLEISKIENGSWFSENIPIPRQGETVRFDNNNKSYVVKSVIYNYYTKSVFSNSQRITIFIQEIIN